MTGAERLPIVLCCAEDTEVALVAVVDALHREGHSTEVVPGVEMDASLLTAAADRVRGPALFVLCQSDDLDRFQVRRLQGLFSARKGPEHQMITVDVHAMGPMAIVPEVRIAAQAESSPALEPEPEDDGRYMRDVVLPSVVTAPGASIPQRPRRHDAVVQEPEGISEEALGLSSESSTPAPPRKIFPEPDVIISTDPTGETVTPFSGRRWDPSMGDGVPREVPQDFPLAGDSGTPSRPGADHSGGIDVDRVSKRAVAADPRMEADARPLPSTSSPIELDDAEPALPPPPPPRRSGRLGLLLLAGAGMAGVVAMAVMHSSAPVGVGPAGAIKERGVPTARGVRGDGAGPEPVEADGPSAADGLPVAGSSTGTPDPTGLQRGVAAGSGTAEGGETGTGLGGGSTGGPTTSASDDGESASTTSDDGEPTAGAAEADGPVDSGGSAPKFVPPPPTAEPSQVQLDAAIDAALAEGRLDAVGEMLISRAGSGTMTWDDAYGRCRRRKVDGLRSWRLPSKGQLVKLRKAKLLQGGSYWSRSVVGGDEVYAIDVSSGRMNVWLKMEPNARAICVRKRP